MRFAVFHTHHLHLTSATARTFPSFPYSAELFLLVTGDRVPRDAQRRLVVPFGARRGDGGSPYVSAVLSLFYAVTTAADVSIQPCSRPWRVPVAEPDIVRREGGGYVFPLFGDDEADWPRDCVLSLRHCRALVLSGCGNRGDLFMAAIERSPSKIYLKTDKKTGKKRVHRFWNPTVANLSLMALGSSAPEIMLNVVEVVGLEFHVGRSAPQPSWAPPPSTCW